MRQPSNRRRSATVRTAAASRPVTEALESRWLLAASATLVGNVLTITGDDTDDTVALSSDNTTFTVVANGVTSTFDAAAVASINVDLKGGNDVETHDGNVPGGTVNLGAGNDALTV